MIVTLTTDFGLRDGYAAALKGSVLSAAPGATLVDVSHEIPAQDVMEAAFVLRQVVPAFPADAVHLAVVDPGVGTPRRAIAAGFEAGGRRHRFVGPDNGILALLAGEAAGEIVELGRADGGAGLDAPARALFGAAAGRLARGAQLSEIGTPIESSAAMHWPLPRTDDQGVDGMVLHVDGFGNCITNITRDDLHAQRDDRVFKCYAGSAVIQAHGATYADVSVGDPVTLFGSSGLLEISVNCGHASRLLSVERGASVSIVYGPAAREPRLPPMPAHAG